MNEDLSKLFEEQDYEENKEIKEIENLKEFEPKKMTKKEFVREMLRLQNERRMYQESEM